MNEMEQEVRRLAHEHPNKTAQCRYVYDSGEPCCIVGHALINLGKMEAGDFDSDLNKTTISASEFDHLGIDPPLASWLEWVQEKQDVGGSWEEAVNFADEYSPLRGD